MAGLALIGGTLGWLYISQQPEAGLNALGLGYLWVMIDRERLSWHDRISRTRLVMLSKG